MTKSLWNLGKENQSFSEHIGLQISIPRYVCFKFICLVQMYKNPRYVPGTEMSLVPKCPRTEMSQGPKCLCTEMSHYLLGAEMSLVPKCLVPKCRYRNVPGRNVWYRNSRQPIFSMRKLDFKKFGQNPLFH